MALPRNRTGSESVVVCRICATSHRVARGSMYPAQCLKCGHTFSYTDADVQQAPRPAKPLASNDGSNAGTNHYDLPAGATELKHLIWYKKMNGQVAEIFRSAYRLGSASHSSTLRDLNKIIAYAEQEKERLQLYPEED